MAQGTLPHCTVKPLLSGHVLAHIQNNSEQDNRALYDVGNVAGDAQEGHAGDNQLHHEHAKDNAGDSAGAADERYAADNGCGNGVGFVVQTQRRSGGESRYITQT